MRVVKSPLRNDFSAASNVFMSNTSIGVVTVAMSVSSQNDAAGKASPLAAGAGFAVFTLSNTERWLTKY
ncbi:hypothetical protein D3C87_1696720 [compost metagenome]